MMSSLSCVVSPSVNETSYTDLFYVVCGMPGSPCAGIQHNATTGTYGAYGMCNATEQLGFALNQYAKSQTNNAQACDFGGSATTRAAVATPSGSCKALMSEAGTAGTGTVTSQPTGTSTASHSGAAGAVTVPNLNIGMLQLGVYVFGAVVAGAGMILL